MKKNYCFFIFEISELNKIIIKKKKLKKKCFLIKWIQFGKVKFVINSNSLTTPSSEFYLYTNKN